MDELIEIFEFLYYSIIFFVIIIFLSITVDIMITKIFPQDTNKYIIVEVFVTWVFLSLILYYSKHLIYQIPNPFTNSKLKKNNLNIVMIMVLVPLIISCCVKNMKIKSGYLYDGIEDFFK